MIPTKRDKPVVTQRYREADVDYVDRVLVVAEREALQEKARTRQAIIDGVASEIGRHIINEANKATPRG